MVKNTQDKPLAQNKKARHDYEIFETFEAGIVLTGTEIKSIRQSKIQLRDGFARVKDGEVWLANVHIAPFEQGNMFNVDETRTRKLLLKKSEIAKIEKELTGTGITFVPLKVYLKNGFAKVLMGLARGKKEYDKRETIKRREQNKDIARQLKIYNR
ncbi:MULTISPECIES: SsrA-binding protein SmpB [unclassified Lactococcus]|uniref:SsrA-binding protein SmpB n=1 Tax=unclassified Lactococcus TaxID=2643510 RepID=UPI0011CB66F5|nr:MULTISPECIES: SsrA-binding protein SmpB [unclassified Lactococcus]MQW22460.1 SsrA-binding protein SmpB [Lactococcus sp. dk101]TXK45488.1 SsrA-binding protein SmpB [Lactococcus sp. dk310]TXK51821.1 SsrA-binding protein SmpB [Lactococcus sp. dk322]